MSTYRGYKITHNPKPIPTRAHDWDFVHEGWDLDDSRIGTGASVEECKRQIDEIEDDGETMSHDPDYKGMLSPSDLRGLADALENANSSAEHLSRLFYAAMKAEKERRAA